MFAGFSKDTLAFFAAIRFNNNREFFEENRDLYESAVRKPLLALAEALAPVVSEIDPLLDTRPARTVSRIHRDVRFGKDKSPYRDYMWIGYRRIGESREDTCGFYFDLSDEAAHWGCGYYHAQPLYMQALRERMLAQPGHMLGILSDEAFASRFALMGDAYTKKLAPPEGLPKELGPLYRKKSVYAEHTLREPGLLLSASLADRLAEDFRVLAPFYTLLRECMARAC